METDEDRFHIRKHPRMPQYNYATPNYYFVTICTKNKRCIFGTGSRNNVYGDLAEAGLKKIPEHFDKVRVDKYAIMPNHIHAIVVLEDGADALPTVIGQYKSYVTRKIHEIDPDVAVWQTSFHDHVIRNQKSYERIWSYIDSNRQKWQEDCYFAEESSASAGS